MATRQRLKREASQRLFLLLPRPERAILPRSQVFQIFQISQIGLYLPIRVIWIHNFPGIYSFAVLWPSLPVQSCVRVLDPSCCPLGLINYCLCEDAPQGTMMLSIVDSLLPVEEDAYILQQDLC
jgi:hypothetical protein